MPRGVHRCERVSAASLPVRPAGAGLPWLQHVSEPATRLRVTFRSQFSKIPAKYTFGNRSGFHRAFYLTLKLLSTWKKCVNLRKSRRPWCQCKSGLCGGCGPDSGRRRPQSSRGLQGRGLRRDPAEAHSPGSTLVPDVLGQRRGCGLGAAVNPQVTL